MSLDVYLTEVRPVTVWDWNITHNLGGMAEEAGVYMHLWRPEEIGIEHAAGLIEPLRSAISLMEGNPARFMAHNPENGWGDYDGLLRFMREYLKACEETPTAKIEVSR